MESKLSYHISKATNEAVAILAETIVCQLLEQLARTDLARESEELLTDIQLCKNLQISTSHFYKLKKKHKDFPVYDIGGAKRYKQSEVEQFFKQLSNGR